MLNNTLQIAIHKKDVAILHMIKTFFDSDCVIIATHAVDYVKMHIKSNKIAEDLFKLGVVPRKTKILKMPVIPHELYTHLIRGYFDGDGSIWFDKQSNSYRIQIVGTKEVLESIKKILLLKDNKLRETNKGNNIYRLSYSGNVIVYNILSMLYKDSRIHLERKYLKYLDCRSLKEYNSLSKREKEYKKFVC